MNHAYYTANDTRSNEDNFPQWTNVLFSVVLPIILIVGITGNLLTLIIMCRKSQRFSSTAVYLSALAVSDTVTLIIYFINKWIAIVFGIVAVQYSNAWCKLYSFSTNVAYFYCTCLV